MPPNGCEPCKLLLNLDQHADRKEQTRRSFSIVLICSRSFSCDSGCISSFLMSPPSLRILSVRRKIIRPADVQGFLGLHFLTRGVLSLADIKGFLSGGGMIAADRYVLSDALHP
jgi:hypothetical protein